MQFWLGVFAVITSARGVCVGTIKWIPARAGHLRDARNRALHIGRRCLH